MRACEEKIHGFFKHVEIAGRAGVGGSMSIACKPPQTAANVRKFPRTMGPRSGAIPQRRGDGHAGSARRRKHARGRPMSPVGGLLATEVPYS